jgi:clan AA aspartic protease
LIIEIEIEGRRVRAKVDTGFEGELILSKENFDAIPFEPSEGPAVCTATSQCYSTYVKYAKVGLGRRSVIAEVLNAPYIEKDLIGEGLLKKLGVVIDYKRGGVFDP